MTQGKACSSHPFSKASSSKTHRRNSSGEQFSHSSHNQVARQLFYNGNRVSHSSHNKVARQLFHSSGIRDSHSSHNKVGRQLSHTIANRVSRGNRVSHN